MSLDNGPGSIAAIDVQAQGVVDGLEIYVPLATARMALARAPDVDEDLIVSWGSVSRDDLTSIVGCEPDPELREGMQAELETFITRNTGCCLTIFYSECYRGQ